MKKAILIICGFVLIAGFCFAEDPVEGYWVNVDGKTGKITTGWEIYQEGGKLYGRILSVAGSPRDSKAEKCKDSYPDFPVPGKVNQMPVGGTPWIYGLNMEKPGQWNGGNVVIPNTGTLFKCKITHHPVNGKKYKVETLEVHGRIGIIGHSLFWRKSSKAEAEGLW
jgi:uncharacterized protein (DUF2147 family)